MAVVVQKYGGTSVADVERIKAVADRVRDTREGGNDIVVVVSAMGETTDRLTTLAARITPTPTPREMDMLLTAGERITMALLAMGLHDRGIDAVSFTGSQAGILTDSSHGAARITEITGERVKEALGMGKVVIVAGFQGVDPATREVTTLGRGGSDTTAVALAATLGADSCEILTDVSGVFTADPRVVLDAVKLDAIGYVEMLELARAGAGILMPDSVSYAQTHHVAVHVRSSFTDGPGTWMRDGEVGSGVVGLAAANRDPEHFADPERFDVARYATDPAPPAHLSFGGGEHLCLGAHLARLESQIAIGRLVERFTELQLIEPKTTWGRSLFRVPARVPVRFRPIAGS